MNIISIMGARPQFIKAAPVSRVLENETEWVETVETGWNVLVGSDRSLIVREVQDMQNHKAGKGAYGDGSASEKILQILEDVISNRRSN